MYIKSTSIHNKSLIYRDVKPVNFLIGPPGNKYANTFTSSVRWPLFFLIFKLKLILCRRLADFGMAKHYQGPEDEVAHSSQQMEGCLRHSQISINMHLGRGMLPVTFVLACCVGVLTSLLEQSQRDDMESSGHVFMYFLRGGLSWQGLKVVSRCAS